MNRFMRRVALLVFMSVAVLGAGCSGKVLDFRNADMSNGLVYAGGENKPFTGKVTNVPEHVIFARREGFVAFNQWVTAVLAGARIAALLQVTPSVCDVHAEDGYLDGKAVCKRPSSQSLKYEIDYKAGALHGSFLMYDLSESKTVVAKGRFMEGKLHGQQEVIGPSSQKVVGRATWENGHLEGVAESFSDSTGERIGRAEYRGGKLHGEYVQYAHDGKTLLYRATGVNGELDGAEETYYASGKAKERRMWRNGKQHGIQESWSEAGALESRNLYRDGAWVPGAFPEAAANTAVTQKPSTHACVDGWRAAHKREVGPDASVAGAQLDEWQQWCDQGRQPPG